MAIIGIYDLLSIHIKELFNPFNQLYISQSVLTPKHLLISLHPLIKHFGHFFNTFFSTSYCIWFLLEEYELTIICLYFWCLSLVKMLSDSPCILSDLSSSQSRFWTQWSISAKKSSYWIWLSSTYSSFLLIDKVCNLFHLPFLKLRQETTLLLPSLKFQTTENKSL